MHTEQLDLRGEICPFTLINTKKRVSQLPLGAVLDVLIDNVDATETIPNWSRNAGHRVDGVEDLPEGGWRIRLQVDRVSS